MDTHKNRNVIIAGIWMMTLMGTVYTYSVFRVHVEQLFDVGTLESGLPYMTSLLFYALSVMVVGRLLTPSRLHLFVITGTLLIALGFVLSAFVTSLLMLVMTYGVLIGTGVGTVYGVPIYVAQKRFPARGGTMAGIVLLGFGMSPLVTAPIARILIESMGLQRTFLIFGLSFLILQLPLSFLFRVKDQGPVVIQPDEIEPVRKPFIRLYVLFALSTTIGLMMIGLSYQTGVVDYGFDPLDVTLALSFFALMNGIARPIFGRLVDQKGFAYSVRLSLFLMAFAAVIGILNQGRFLWLFILSFGLFWFNLGAWLAMIPVAVKTIYGMRAYAKIYGIIFTAYGVGAVVGTLISGTIMDVLKETTYLYILVLALIAVALGFAGFSRQNQKV
ncbi:MAG: MFS transporter [Acholeplasmataceae bacterium]|nr:MFS transporter [Acholeplasmataceae bacterium]